MSGVFSKEAEKELLEGAASESLRRDFQILRENARPRDPGAVDLDWLLLFLTEASRFNYVPPPRREADDYKRRLI